MTNSVLPAVRARGRRWGNPVIAIVCLSAIPANTACAQTPASLSADSLAARLERAEEAIELLRQQLATQAQAQVQTRSRAALEFSGRVLTTGYYNSRRVNNLDVPQFVSPDIAATTTGTPAPVSTAGGVIRQTSLALAASGLRALGADASADIDLDFAGGAQSGSGGHGTFPQPRLRTARGILRWPHAELLAGQDVPLIAGLNPLSLASISTPDFATAGNLWLWLPQIRGGFAFGSVARFGAQAAILAPNSGDTRSGDADAVDIAERSHRPSLEGRLHVGWGDEDRGGDIGIGAHVGWLLEPGTDSLRRSNAVAADLRIPLGWLELRGEAYVGRLLKGLGGGGIGQNFGAAAASAPAGSVGPIIRDRGAWAQLNLRPGRQVIGGGCGADDPDDDDRPTRQRNTQCEGHLILRPAGPLVLGVEYRRLRTTYASGAQASSHLNLGIGAEF